MKTLKFQITDYAFAKVTCLAIIAQAHRNLENTIVALFHHVVVDLALQWATGKRHGFVFDGKKYTKDPFHEEFMSS